MRERLMKLIEATDKVIHLAFNVKKAFCEPINWADLQCVAAGRMVRWNGDEYDVVHIEEASPECPIFQTFVNEHLARAGYPDVEVRTEW